MWTPVICLNCMTPLSSYLCECRHLNTIELSSTSSPVLPNVTNDERMFRSNVRVKIGIFWRSSWIQKIPKHWLYLYHIWHTCYPVIGLSLLNWFSMPPWAHILDKLVYTRGTKELTEFRPNLAYVSSVMRMNPIDFHGQGHNWHIFDYW